MRNDYYDLIMKPVWQDFRKQIIQDTENSNIAKIMGNSIFMMDLATRNPDIRQRESWLCRINRICSTALETIYNRSDIVD